jgi:integrase
LNSATKIIAKSSPLLDRKIEEISAGLAASSANNLHSISEDNAATIVKYIGVMKVETNLADHYRKDLIEVLCRFSKYNDNKPYRDLTRDNIITFLETFRKTETQDPLHKWIGTYNIFRIHLLRFFKWLYYPDIEPDKRSKPLVIENIPKLKRKEKSIYKPSDLWTQQDDLLFLKYCPTKRVKCYHAISRDLSCRPHEILKLKIKDIAFKTIGTCHDTVESFLNSDRFVTLEISKCNSFVFRICKTKIEFDWPFNLGILSETFVNFNQ